MPTGRALIVCTHPYDGLTTDVDVIRMKELLISRGFDCVVLDNTAPDKMATRDNVIRLLKTAAMLSLPGDIFVFYYSGHGAQIADLSKRETDYRQEILCLCGCDLFLNTIDKTDQLPKSTQINHAQLPLLIKRDDKIYFYNNKVHLTKFDASTFTSIIHLFPQTPHTNPVKLDKENVPSIVYYEIRLLTNKAAMCYGDLPDSKLHEIWRTFKTGTRVFMMTDCCHSGTAYGHDRESWYRFRFMGSETEQLDDMDIGFFMKGKEVYCRASDKQPFLISIPRIRDLIISKFTSKKLSQEEKRDILDFILKSGYAFESSSEPSCDSSLRCTPPVYKIPPMFIHFGATQDDRLSSDVGGGLFTNAFIDIMRNSTSAPINYHDLSQKVHDRVISDASSFHYDIILVEYPVRQPQLSDQEATDAGKEFSGRNDDDPVLIIEPSAQRARIYGKVEGIWKLTELDYQMFRAHITPFLVKPQIAPKETKILKAQCPQAVYDEVKSKDGHRVQEPQLNCLWRYDINLQTVDSSYCFCDKKPDPTAGAGVGTPGVGTPYLLRQGNKVFMYGKRDNSPYLYLTELRASVFTGVSFPAVGTQSELLSEDQKVVKIYHEIERAHAHNPLFSDPTTNPFLAQSPFEISPSQPPPKFIPPIMGRHNPLLLASETNSLTEVVVPQQTYGAAPPASDPPQAAAVSTSSSTTKSMASTTKQERHQQTALPQHSGLFGQPNRSQFMDDSNSSQHQQKKATSAKSHRPEEKEDGARTLPQPVPPTTETGLQVGLFGTNSSTTRGATNTSEHERRPSTRSTTVYPYPDEEYGRSGGECLLQ